MNFIGGHVFLFNVNVTCLLLVSLTFMRQFANQVSIFRICLCRCVDALICQEFTLNSAVSSANANADSNISLLIGISDPNNRYKSGPITLP